MEISDETRNLLKIINDFSSKKIKNTFEISALIEAGTLPDGKKKFEELIFTSKYVNGLKSVLSNRSITGDQYIENMFNEFNVNLQKVIGLLKEVITGFDKNISAQFENKYFLLDQESIINSMELIEDLSLCKEFFNVNPDSLPVKHLK